MKSRSSAAYPWTFFLICCAVLVSCGDTAQAQERARKRKERKVSGWGLLEKPVKDSDFFEITYFKKTGKGPRQKVTKTEAFLKVTSKSLLYQDIRIPITGLEANEEVRIFGKPVSERVPDRGGGRGGVDSQIQNARVVLGGELESRLPFNKEYSDPAAPDLKWVDAQVKKTVGGLWVTASGVDNRVTMEKGAPVLKRAKVKPEHLKGRLYIQFFAYTTRERPDTGKKADEKKDSFRAAMIVILDRGSLTSVYPAMWKR